MTGQLSVTLDGQPVKILADGKAVSVFIPSLRTAWKLRSLSLSQLSKPIQQFGKLQIPVTVRVGKFSFQLLPNPGFSFRFLFPQLARLLDGERS